MQAQKAQIQEILTTETWEWLTSNFETAYGAESAVYTFLSDIDGDLAKYTELFYSGLMTIVSPDVVPHVIADIAFLHMGDAFRRIFDSLTAEYDPLENFFTKGKFEKKGSIENEKSGTESTTPEGKIKVKNEGQTSSENEKTFSVGQVSTYDSATTTPPATDAAANDLYNVSRNIHHNKVKTVLGNNGADLPTTTTEYEDYHVDKTFDDRKDTTTYNDYEEDTDKKGNSGIFSKQDLTQREIRLRIKNRIIPIYVRMVVDTFSAGVWADDN